MLVFKGKSIEHLLGMSMEIISIRQDIAAKRISHAQGYALIDDVIEKCVGSDKTHEPSTGRDATRQSAS